MAKYVFSSIIYVFSSISDKIWITNDQDIAEISGAQDKYRFNKYDTGRLVLQSDLYSNNYCSLKIEVYQMGERGS